MLRAWMGICLTSVLITGVPAVGAAQESAADTPRGRGPTVVGVTLRDSSRRVLAALGSPELRSTFFAFRVWEYPGRGITLMWSEGDDELRIIIVAKRGAGDVAGVRVGDALATARARWGTPARSRQDGRYVDFPRSGWMLSAEVMNQKINEITLMAISEH